MKHPFTPKDIMDACDACDLTNIGMSNMDAVLQAAWDSAVARGAVEETYSAPGWKQHVDAYIIKLPEDKT